SASSSPPERAGTRLGAAPDPPRAAGTGAVDLEATRLRTERDEALRSAAEAWQRVAELEADLAMVRAELADERATQLREARIHIAELRMQVAELRRERGRPGPDPD
ncbi:hypothetical protein Q2298_24180, partial [Rhodococcus electrodiphilus]|nr:hypothetical protein [Rhodococcus ruber]